MLEKEYRNANISDVKEDDGKLIIEGYPIVFESETLIGNEERGFYEVIDKNAIDMSALKDCCLKYNHENSTLILARVRNKSLQLTIDDKGVFMHAELQSNVSQHRDVYNLVKSGLLDKMSFGFIIKDQEVNRNGNLPVRRITKISKVLECSIVDTPAYDDTSVYARSLEMVEKEIEGLDNEAEQRAEQAAEEEKRKAVEEAELEKIKLRIKLNLI